MKEIKNRILAGLLAACLTVGFLPMGTQAALAESSDYITQQLYLGESLKLHLRGNVDYLYAENAVATVAYGNRVYTYRLEDLNVCQDGQREIVVDLAAAQMTENVALTIKVGNVVVVEKTYSIRDYLETLLEGGYTWQTEQLCAELLNYGAWAQKYFDYNSDDLANRNYQVTPEHTVPSDVPVIGVSGKVSGIKCKGATIRLASKVAVRYYFDAPNGVAGYTFTVDGKTYTPVSKDGLYYVEVPGIHPQDMEKKMHVEVTDSTNTLYFDYAPTDFLIRSYHKTTDETYRGLLEAAYSYFTSARQYTYLGSVGQLQLDYETGSSRAIQAVTTLPSDTAVADFTFSENGCSVNQSANQYQTASKVTMAKQDNKILLTFCFDSDFAAGQTYTLPQGAVFGFADGKQYALTQDYLFRYNGTDWSIVEPEGDFLKGVGFEAEGNTLLITGQGRANRDALISRVAYSTQTISKPANGGSYALKLSHRKGEGTFRVNFGRELSARTRLTFMAYSVGTQSRFAVNDTVTNPAFVGLWTELTVTLQEDARYIDLLWTASSSEGTVYLDNFLAVEPVENANLLMGFESYQEMTGAKIAVGNSLGRMEINKDIHYITQGDASLKVVPQGDYSKPGYHPYFKLDLENTNFKFNDFSNIKDISFDVYNPENQPLRMGVGIVAGADYENYLTANKQSFTLAPGSWTTCHYDLSYMAGYQFYDLTNVRYMVFEFLDHKESKNDSTYALYLDNLYANAYAEGEGPVTPDFDYMTGIDFENPGQEYLFTGQGIKNRDADIERITYYDNGTVAAPAGGGSYGVRLRHESNYWPTFRLHFGQELPGGTEITFMAYGRILNGTSLYNQSVFEFSSGGDATEEFACGQWTQVFLTLPADASYIDLFWNYDRAGITSANASGELYIDNIIIVQSEPYGDILEGYGFEERGNAERFTGQGNSTTDATIRRFTYDYLGVDAPNENSGEYALKLTHAGSMTPTFRINFGKTLAAGTTISFDAYAKIVSGYVYPQKNVINHSDGTNATDSFNFKTWKTLSVTLPQDSAYIDLTWSFKGTFGTAVSELYIDNIKAVEPEIEPTGDFMAGVGFEEKGNAELFTGQGVQQDAVIRRVEYADLSIDAPTDGGSYALKLSHDSNYWPTFRINFGEELTAGTEISFWAYGSITSGECLYDQSIFEFTGGGEATAQFKHGQWTQLTLTLPENKEYIDLFWNYDRAGITSATASGVVYLDNFLAVEPKAEGDIMTGYDFETKGNELLFESVGGSYAGRDAVLIRVPYTDAGIAAPANGGSYALKLTHSENYWPVFRLNFGKTLTAGTVISFDAYTRDVTTADIETVTVFEYLSGGDATAQYYYNSWNSLSFTLKEDCEYVDLVCTLDRWSKTTSAANIEVFMDNFKASEPVEGFTAGFGFENAAESDFFAGQGKWNDAVIERVAYANTGITAPTDGGSYALKLSHDSNYWPTFRISFGTTLKAGTKITFMAYGKITSGTNLYNQSIFEYSAGGEATAQFKCDGWTELTITLNSDLSYIDLFWNYDRAGITSATASGEVYLDNFRVVEP